MLLKKEDNDMNGTGIMNSRPVPDPTTLTTDQTRREVAGLRELLEGRLEGMDTATELVKATTDKIPCLIDGKIQQLKMLTDEKFVGIDKQFLERDTRTDKIAELGQKALEAALSAAKEAVGKTEISFTKQIDATAAQIQAEKTAADDKFEDVKSRLGTLEASINTRQVVTTERSTQQGWVIPMFVVGGFSLVGIALQIILILKGLN